MAAPTLPDAVAQLYAGPPADFVRSRDALVAAAKEAQDPDLARQIKALRRPSAAAHLINRLSASGDLGELASLGERLRAAQSQLDASAMKTLGVERHQLIDDLTERACAGEPSVTSAVREQLRATFTAALADPQAGRAVESGAFVTALSYSGFGEVDLSDALATPLTLLQGGRSEDAPDGDEAASDDDRRRTAQQDAARRAAAARSAREQARLERAEDAVEAAQQAVDRAQARLDEARSAVRDAKATLQRAEADRRTAQERVAQAEQVDPARS
ncbi:hypothetical protein [Allobranchiibius sp. GilTou38]|uniref:hypothetical protein n=1 Tax=Allobranchiibius sp. GilTou38 TaxID=2815210 RepID=UPI001AA1BDF7|nr:hypothetical protein [Allobranchiibius sp. GilTou38]MBO1767226.1 hypothetical protein [Allobranchiibius sp. GilTou38]